MTKTIIHAMGMASKKYGGLERMMISLVQSMNDFGFKTVIVYNELPTSKDYISKLENLGCEIKVLNINHPLSYTIGFLRILIKFKPQIVHAHFNYYLPILLAGLTFRKKRFVMLHSMLVGSDFNPISTTKQLKFLTNTIREISLKVSNGITTVSDSIRTQYVSLYKLDRKIKTIYLGQSLNSLSKKKIYLNLFFPPKKIKICCIAFDSPVKGLDVLIRALAMLRYKYKNDNFLLFQVGVKIENSFTDLLLTAEKLGVSDMIIWLGIRNDIQSILHEMDIYCQPSRSEGLTLSIVEASLAGIPTVGTNIGGIPEAVIDGVTGLLFESENSDDLAIKLNALIIDEEMRRKMGAEALKYSNIKFDIIEQTKKIVDYYFQAKQI